MAIGRTRLLALTFLLGLFVAGSAAQTPAAREIDLPAPGQMSVVIDRLEGIKDIATFMFRSGAPVTLRIELIGMGPMRGLVIFPSGKTDGGPGGVVFDHRLDEPGFYQLQVTESLMAEKWRGEYSIRLGVRD